MGVGGYFFCFFARVLHHLSRKKFSFFFSFSFSNVKLFNLCGFTVRRRVGVGEGRGGEGRGVA